MANTSYREIRDSLTQLYLDDPRPWLVGFSGGKDGALLGLIFDAPASAEQLSVPAEQRKKPVTVLCTDTRVEIPAIESVSVQTDIHAAAHAEKWYSSVDLDGV